MVIECIQWDPIPGLPCLYRAGGGHPAPGSTPRVHPPPPLGFSHTPPLYKLQVEFEDPQGSAGRGRAVLFNDNLIYSTVFPLNVQRGLF